MESSDRLHNLQKKASKKKWSSRSRKAFFMGIIFALPWLIGFLIFQLYPIVASSFYSFTDFNLFQTPKWVGTSNYSSLFSDHRFWQSLYNTLYMTIIGVPISLFIALLCALALNFKVRGQAVYRAIFFLPTMVPIVPATFLWLWLLNGQYGAINLVLNWFGIHGPLWMQAPGWTKPALILMGLWLIGSTIMIYLAALQEVPEMYYEAAEIDGAGWWSKFWHITWPAVSPITLFQLVIGIIGAFQYFTQVFIMTSSSSTSSISQAAGGPADSLLLYPLYLFQNAFTFFKMGTASAMAWIMFLITMLVSLVVLLSSRKWVYYGGE
jgi:multiple sugar transport system permease protein